MAGTRPIGFWLKLVDRLIDERFATILEEHGVTRRQWQLLGVVAPGGATVGQLDQAIAPFLDAGSGESSVEHLAELIDSDWVEVTGASYELTERGRAAFSRLTQVVDRLRDQTGDGLSQDEYETTVRSLERMAQNLGFHE